MVHIIWNVFQTEKLAVLEVLVKVASLQDRTSDDCERYLKMGLRLAPNCANMNFRNEKYADYPFIHKEQITVFQI